MATMIFLSTILLMVFIVIIIRGIFIIHKLQQLSYKNLKLVDWLQSNRYRNVLLWDIFELFMPMLFIYILFYAINTTPYYKHITSLIMFIVFTWKILHPFFAGWIGFRAKLKKKLIYTQRVIRLLITFLILTVITLIFSFYFTATPIDDFTLSAMGFLKFNAFILFLSIISPILIIVSNLINFPIEQNIRMIYFNKARRKLSKTNIITIGITGSFGKTSTKFFLNTILNEHYKSICTPESYNTPMGVSKVINSTDLSLYDTFVCEMGADRFGDIEHLCKLAPPDHSIISAIGVQHLETFYTINNIIETKLSLFNKTKTNGFKVYNYDSEILRENIDKLKNRSNLYSYTINPDFAGVTDISAKDIKNTRDGLQFTVCFKDNTEFVVKAKLLGNHNVSNILGAVLLSSLIGVSKDKIVNGIAKITPVPHRLQLIDPGTGVLVLDDAFNSNLEGAVEALRILNEIEGNKKIIITPGFIELGEKDKEYNYNLGSAIAKYSDIAILVGKNKTIDIKSGIIDNQNNHIEIHDVNSLEEAQEILKAIVRSGDIILFENDLPDTFSE